MLQSHPQMNGLFCDATVRGSLLWRGGRYRSRVRMEWSFIRKDTVAEWVR